MTVLFHPRRKAFSTLHHKKIAISASATALNQSSIHSFSSKISTIPPEAYASTRVCSLIRKPSRKIPYLPRFHPHWYLTRTLSVPYPYLIRTLFVLPSLQAPYHSISPFPQVSPPDHPSPSPQPIAASHGSLLVGPAGGSLAPKLFGENKRCHTDGAGNISAGMWTSTSTSTSTWTWTWTWTWYARPL